MEAFFKSELENMAHYCTATEIIEALQKIWQANADNASDNNESMIYEDNMNMAATCAQTFLNTMKEAGCK